jgi:predicted metal-dependent HD superfamily phosphohydrolase
MTQIQKVGKVPTSLRGEGITEFLRQDPQRMQTKRLDAVKAYSAEHMPRLAYHNYAHVEDVVKACHRMAYFEGVSPADRELLITAAYLHDIIYVPFTKYNEEKSARTAAEILPGFGYGADEVEAVKSMIMATKLPQTPKSLIERILCDADLDNLGREDFLPKCEAVRTELGIGDRLAWFQGTLKLLAGHLYHTETARESRQFGKARNIKLVVRLISGTLDESGAKAAA